MLKAQDILPDTYRGGRYVRQWDIVNGQPCCVLDALDVASASPDAVAAARQRNRVVAERIAAVEAFEDAVLLGDQAALATVAAASELTKAYALVRNGRPAEPSEGGVPSPEWVAYLAACELIDIAE